MPNLSSTIRVHQIGQIPPFLDQISQIPPNWSNSVMFSQKSTFRGKFQQIDLILQFATRFHHLRAKNAIFCSNSFIDITYIIIYISMLRIEYRLGLTQKYPLLWMRIELSHKERLLKPC